MSRIASLLPLMLLAAVVLAGDDAPTLDPLPPLIYPESTLNAAQCTLHVTGIGPGSPAKAGQVLTVQASTADDELAVLHSIVFDAASGTAAIRFRPITYAHGTCLIYVSVRDESGAITVRTGQLTATPMPDVPQLSLNGTFVAPGQSVVLDATNIRAYDPDDPPPETLVLTLTQAPFYGEYLLAGVTVINPGGTFTFADVLAGRVSYHHTAPVIDDIYNVDRLHLRLSDGALSTPFETFTFIYVDRSPLPVIQMGQPTQAWSEGGGPVPLCSSSLTWFSSGSEVVVSIAILAPEVRPDDRILVQGTGLGPGRIWVEGPTISYLGEVVGTWSGGHDGLPLVARFPSGSDQFAVVQSFLVALRFDHVGRGPGANRRSIQAVLEHAQAGTSLPAMIDLDLHLVDDPPRVATTVVGALAGFARAVDLVVQDADSTTCTWSVLSQPALARVDLVDAAAGRILITPGPGFSGSDAFLVAVDDGVNPPEVATIGLLVSGFEDVRPQALADAPFSAQAGETLTADLTWDADVSVAADAAMPAGLVLTRLSARSVRLDWPVPAGEPAGLRAFSLFAEDAATHAIGRLPLLLQVRGLPEAAQ